MMARSKKKPAVAVLGAGNWGSAIANLIACNGHDVLLWCRRQEQADELNNEHTNQHYVPGLRLSDRIRATSVLRECVERVPLLFMVVPSKAFRDVCREAGEIVTPEQLLIHATKGFEAGTHARMSQIIRQETCIKQLGVLSGPNIAQEIVEGRPSGTVVASKFPRLIAEALKVLVSPRFRVYSGDDVAGVELCGALKNVVAIAAGIASQLQLGENARALLITRGLAEMRRLSDALGARAETCGGVAGLGDLIVTCSSPLSRNNRVGAALARGEKLPDIIDRLGMVAEGVNTARVAHEIIARHSLEAPVFEAVHRIVHQGESPQEALSHLMGLESRPDVA